MRLTIFVLLILGSCSVGFSKGWEIEWSDNFNKINRKNWTVNNRVIRGETYLSPDLVSIKKGKLTLRADSVDGFFNDRDKDGKRFKNDYTYRGGQIDTLSKDRSAKAKRTIGVGNRVDWRVNHGFQKGCISALWGGRVNPAPAADGPDRAAPAIAFGSLVYKRWADEEGIKLGFLSNRGARSERRQTVFYDPRKTLGEAKGTIPGKFRVFRTDWRAKRFEIFYDGVKVKSITDASVIPDGRLALQMRFAPFEGTLNGGTPPNKFNAKTVVDWIKVYKFQ